MARPNPEFTQPPQTTTRTRVGNGVTGEVWDETNSYLTVDPTIRNYYRTWTGTTTPGYWTLGKGKKLPMNDYLVRYVRVSDSSFYSYAMPKSNYIYTDYSVQHARVVDPFIPSTYGFSAYEEARRKSLSRLQAKVNDMRVNLAQAFGERKQTASLLADTAVRIATAARALRRGDFRTAGASLGLTSKKGWNPSQREIDAVIKTHPTKRIANHWLELQYGWKPLLQDAFGAAELLGDKVRLDTFNTRVKSSGRHYQFSTGKSLGATIWNGSVFSHCQVRFVLTYRMDDEARAILSQTGISNPALLAWELLPYSFVVDWFIPVGNYLESLMTYDGFVLVDGTESRTETWNFSKNFSYSKDDLLERSYAYGHANFNEVLYHRKSLDGFPHQALPKFRNPLGGDPLTRFLTAASLIRVLFRR